MKRRTPRRRYGPTLAIALGLVGPAMPTDVEAPGWLTAWATDAPARPRPQDDAATTIGPVGGAAGGAASARVSEAAVQAVAAQLRCVVCLNLSVADSPSEMASQMREIIRQRLAGGETPDQVTTYFVARYGEWILLSPTPRGFNLLVWAAPVVALCLGLLGVSLLIRRWTRPSPRPEEPPVDPVLRERLRRELEQRR